MRGLKYLMVITRREYAEAYLDFFKKNGVKTVFATVGHGTANDKILEYLSLDQSDKIMFQAMVSAEKLHDIKRGLTHELRLNENGNGIALTLPIEGVGGKSALEYLAGDYVPNGEDNMEEFKYSLIITVVNQGFVDAVMDAARNVNARGGTFIKAKGTGAGFAEKFFGVSITEEKEMVYIVAKRDDRDAIMRAIMDAAGFKTEAHGAVFALPVDSVAGVSSLLED